jgi:hypothetical protein
MFFVVSINPYPVGINAIDYRMYKYTNNTYNDYTSDFLQVIITTCKINNLVILSDPYSLYELSTVKKFRLNVSKWYLERLCILDKIDILEYLHDTGKISNNNVEYISSIPYTASKYCNIKVLNWWLKSNLPLIYTETALDSASEKGHVEVLEWWLKSNLPLKYTKDALDNASFNGHIDVLEWWLKSGLELKYSCGTMNLASFNGHIDVLEWWFKSGLKLKYSENALTNASGNGHIHVLDWWKNSKRKLKYNEKPLSIALYNSRMDVLNWWVNSGLALKYPQCFKLYDYSRNIEVFTWLIDQMIKSSGTVYVDLDKLIDTIQAPNESIHFCNIFEMCKKKPVKFVYTINLFDYGISYNLIDILELMKTSGLTSPDVFNGYTLTHYRHSYRSKYYTCPTTVAKGLEWWKNSGFPLIYTEDAVDTASKYGIINELNWWLNSGLEIKYSELAIYYAVLHADIEVLNWWSNSGLPLKIDKDSVSLQIYHYYYSDYHTDDVKTKVVDWWIKNYLSLEHIK